MGMFTTVTRPRAGGDARPGAAPLGSGRRLRSSRSPEESAGLLRELFEGYRPRRYRELPSLVPAGIQWMTDAGRPSLALSGKDDANNFLLFTLAEADGATEAGIFPLGSGDTRLALRVAGHWKQRDPSLSSTGTWAPLTVRLAPPPVSEALIDGMLQAARYAVTPGNRACAATQFTTMFLAKGRAFVSSREGAPGAERFAALHAERADWTSLTGPLRSALQLLAEWEPAVLPYIQDLPLRCRAILLERVEAGDGFWSSLDRG